MIYLGMAPSQGVTRSFWRVVLAGGFWDIGAWPLRVDAWKAGVDQGSDDLALAAASSAANATPGGAFQTERAVVDVHILGVDQGVTVDKVARWLNGLKAGVSVYSVQLVSNSDPVARAAALDAAKAAADNDPFDKFIHALMLTGKIAAAVGVAYVAAQLIRAVRK